MSAAALRPHEELPEQVFMRSRASPDHNQDVTSNALTTAKTNSSSIGALALLMSANDLNQHGL